MLGEMGPNEALCGKRLYTAVIFVFSEYVPQK